MCVCAVEKDALPILYVNSIAQVTSRVEKGNEESLIRQKEKRKKKRKTT